MRGMPSDYHREKARSGLAARGLYPPQGRLHGMMYPMAIAAGMSTGVGLAGVPTWIVVAMSIAVFVAGLFLGFKIDDDYEQKVIATAQEMAETKP